MDIYLKKIKDFLKKIGKKKIIIGSIASLSIIILLVTISNYIERKNFEKKVNKTEYNTYEDFKTAREYIIYSGNEYIKEESSKVEGIETDIYLKFKEAPFENGVNNEDDYNTLIYIVANTLNFYNFRLIDEDKDLTIIAECDQNNKKITRILINGEENYFSKENSIRTLEKYNQNQGKEFNIQSDILKNIINNNWNASTVNPSERKETKNDYFVYDQYMVMTISKKIYNIVFLNEYKEEVINNLKVGATQEEIIEELGEPDFKQYEVIGYKGKDIYVFFGKSTISIYRVEDFTEGNDEFIELLKNFRENKNSKQLVSKLTDIWDDYNEFEVEGDYINIEYALRGFKIQFNVTNEHGIIFYGNYRGEIEKGISLSNIKNKEEIPLYTYIYAEEDLVKEAEIKRAFKFREISE